MYSIYNYISGLCLYMVLVKPVWGLNHGGLYSNFALTLVSLASFYIFILIIITQYEVSMGWFHPGINFSPAKR